MQTQISPSWLADGFQGTTHAGVVQNDELTSRLVPGKISSMIPVVFDACVSHIIHILQDTIHWPVLLNIYLIKLNLF